MKLRNSLRLLVRGIILLLALTFFGGLYFTEDVFAAFNSGGGNGGGGGSGSCPSDRGFYPSEGCHKYWVYKRNNSTASFANWGRIDATYYGVGNNGHFDQDMARFKRYLDNRCSFANGYFIYTIGSGNNSPHSTRVAAYKRVGSPSGGSAFNAEGDYSLTNNTIYANSSVRAAFRKVALDNGRTSTWVDNNWGDTAWFCYDSNPPWYTTPDTQIRVNGGAWTDSNNVFVQPGQRIDWRHRFSASGYGNPPSLDYGWVAGTNGGSSDVTRFSRNVGVEGTSPWNNSPTSGWDTVSSIPVPSNAPTGRSYCRSTSVSRGDSYNDDRKTGDQLCAVVTAPPPSVYSIACSVVAYSAATGGSVITRATPGQTVYFDYRIWNNGPNTSTSITYTPNGTAGNGSPRTIPGTSPSNNIAARSSLEAVTIPSNAAVGSLVSRSMTFSPTSNTNAAAGNCSGSVTVIGWSITPTTTITSPSGATVEPGATITWRHTITATGVADPPNVQWGWRQTNAGTDSPTLWNNNFGATGTRTQDQTSTYQVPPDAVGGTEICRRTVVRPSAHNNANESASGPACRTVAYTYTLIPIIQTNPSTVTPGEEVTFTTAVRNETSRISNSTDWVVRRIVIPAGATLPNGWSNTRSGTNATQFNCTYYTNLSTGITCSSPSDPSGTRSFNGGELTPVGSGTYTETAGPIGTRICYAVMINSYNQNAGNYREAVSCATVAKYPALTVEQGMVRTGGAFSSTTGTCTLAANQADRSNILMHDYNSTARGSYGLAGLAVGRINYFGSHNEYYGKETSDALRRSLLFANSQNDDNKGYFLGATPASTFCLPNTTSLYATRGSSTPSTTPPATPVTPTASVNYTLSNNTLTLAGGTINPGNQVVIRVTGTGTIRITGDILYGPTPTDLAAGQRVPQFILLADGNINIQIADTVTELNGVYSTKGNIYTCFNTASTVAYNGSQQMTADDCTGQLTIKGALIANQVLPYRTHGYNNSTDTAPAEIFRLTPETLIGDYQYSQDNPILRTVRQRELPVRL